MSEQMADSVREQNRELLTVPETADLLRHARGTLDNWRSRGKGPPYIRLGGRVLYDREAVLTWARARTRTSTTDPVEAA